MERVLVVVNKDGGWAKHGDRVEEAPKGELAAIRANFYALRLAQTLTPLAGKEYQLSPLGEVKVGDRAALGVKAVQKDRPEVSLYFDKETMLPVKVELRAKPRDDAQEIAFEFRFAGHKEMGGVKHPGKVTMTMDGKKLLEMEVTEVKAEGKLDDSTFAKP